MGLKVLWVLFMELSKEHFSLKNQNFIHLFSVFYISEDFNIQSFRRFSYSIISFMLIFFMLKCQYCENFLYFIWKQTFSINR